MGEKQELTFEEMMSSLDECVKNLESEDISLEDSFHIYEQGMKLIKLCNDKIDRVEKKVLKLEQDGSLQEIEFDRKEE